MTSRGTCRWCNVLGRLAIRGLALVVPVGLVSAVVVAVVTITGFAVIAGSSEIYANWETASEIDNLGFYVWRSETESTGYAKLPLGAPSEQFIPSKDEFGVGAQYEFVDVQVTPGVRYYYKVEDIPASGGGTMVGPVSAMVPLPATNTPAPGPATSTPTPDVRLWADPVEVAAGGCSTVLWLAENVRAVYFDGEGVPGEGARAFCPCADEMHVLRVQYRDGGWQDLTVTIAVTGACGPTSGSSPLKTPIAPAILPATAAPTEAQPDGGVSVRPTTAPLSESPPATPLSAISPIATPTQAIALSGTASSSADSPVPSPAPSGTSLSGPVEADPASRTPWRWVGLVIALVSGSALMAGGLWIWKRGR
jgi:hypothetical protein